MLKEALENAYLWEVLEALKEVLPSKVCENIVDHHFQYTSNAKAIAILLVLGETHYRGE